MLKLFLLLMQFLLNTKRNALIKPRLDEDMTLIADFGCGHFPNKFANVLVDQATSQDEQRGGLTIRKSDASTFHNLDLNVFPYPFPDRHFDFLICNHVLEHLDDPVQACAEFSRIAKAGYIEVPFYCADLYVRNNDMIHKWLCAYEPEPGTLHFLERRAFLGHLPPRPINIFLRFILQLKNVSVTWKDQIRADYLRVDPAPRPDLPGATL